MRKELKVIQCIACYWTGTKEQTKKIQTHRFKVVSCECPKCGCSSFYENRIKKHEVL